MPSIEGVRKVNEWIMQNGRTIIVTDPTVQAPNVPDGTLLVNPTGVYSTANKQIMVKPKDATDWVIIDPVNIFSAGSIVNSLIGNSAVKTNNIAAGNVTSDCLESSVAYNVANAFVVDTNYNCTVKREKPVITTLYGDLYIKDTSPIAPFNHRTLSVEGRISSNGNITSLGSISAAGDIASSGKISATSDIISNGSITAVMNITAGNTITANAMQINGVANISGSTAISADLTAGSIVSNGDVYCKKALTVDYDCVFNHNLTLADNAFINGYVNIKGAINGGSTLTITNGDIITNQNISATLAITAGKDITSTNGGLFVSNDIKTSKGNIIASSGGISSYGNIVSTAGNVQAYGTVIAGNGVNITAGDLDINDNIVVQGNISAPQGVISALRIYDSTFNDLAEAYKPAERTEPGDIVEITDDFTVKKASENSTSVVGVHSDCYAALYGATEEEIKKKEKVAIGLVGKVPIKIVGKAVIGQLVVSAGGGIGKTIDRNKYVPGTVVGKVLENKDFEGLGLVVCLVFPS